jgi:MoaA/NifB/PqqE/SkfB family radical SAM enzyme
MVDRKSRTLARRFWMLQHNRPIWTEYPESVMIETQNRCNIDCEYCNPQHSFNIPKGRMKTEMFYDILHRLGKKLYWSIAPFMDGEPLLDERLPEFYTAIQNICDTRAVLITNGTLWERRHSLIHPNLKEVRFTISAITPETYLKVMRRPYFHRAMSTFYWFVRNKLRNQTPRVNFIETKNNAHEREEWIKHFSGFRRILYKVHTGMEQLNSDAVRTEETDMNVLITEKNKVVPVKPLKNGKYYPCTNWDVMAIAWDGTILHCNNFPYKYNWGNIKDTDLMDAWRERSKNMMDNPCCNSCGLRFPNWKKIVEKYAKYVQ